ncbi:male sterility protein-domain-containing protein [Flammula alnicola]|nr:male sterility protein-domain-containing protein [Flammula alnicola]
MVCATEVFQAESPDIGGKPEPTSPSRGLQTPSGSPQTLSDILSGQTILVTGAGGFVGTALIHRLVDPLLRVRRVFALIHGQDASSRFPKDLIPSVAKVNEKGDFDTNKLVVLLAGDCSVPGFGLSAKENKLLQDVDIVIHCAGNTKFTLPLPNAIDATAGLAYTTCQFTLGNAKVRTHIHLSTCFTGWFLPSGSIVHEELVPAIDSKVQYEEHPNTYLHAKSIAEGIVNAVGRDASKNVAWRILRISTLGPALSFPTPGWGAGHTSSPLCASIAAEVVDNPTSILNPEAELDTIPVDIAVNQILGLTAAAHRTGANNPSYPLPHGSNVPIYHIAVGHGSAKPIPMMTLNKRDFKIARPYVSAKNIVAIYRPMMTKVVRFDTSRMRRVIGLPLYPEAKGWSDKGKANGIIGGGTMWVTDAPVDMTGFEVDLDTALEKSGGWVPYLQLIRDKMEKTQHGL